MKLNRKRRRYWNTNRPQVLVVNMAGDPINVYDWEDAVSDIFNQKNSRAIVLQTYDDVWLRSGKNLLGELTVNQLCPSVIMMVDCKPSEFNIVTVKGLPLTKRNVYERDKGRCCYCERKIPFSEATRDHVYPISRGGLNDWMNVRCACLTCNNNKEDKTLSELGWKLKRRVGVPTLSKEAPKNIIYYIGGRIPHESWRPYITWEVKVKEKVREDVVPVQH